ncbi:MULTISPECIES: DUF1217 domain-containing protein [unclassified Neorhizobium]|uniref:DUF1217 domain-containing protein n=1 Tax=unclassified Neorhizobium TaxID=2629175 RepID=UPI001FF6C622|nr:MULTISPECIES: DUF1217 domain-containing protein [unclassified Neorhizobium]MCJ9671320.1 DUF1217 domain-containing protein [Neorhizobium sp. SHOUNA12B]MCJ9745661.1 DUF1217 domain-containing protein [Neorhizobium sp. SHOUNA12A]
MVSTYLTFDLVNRDMQKSLKNIAGQTTVVNDTKYYQDNIGKVKTVDEFLGNYRLYSYAMQAHGLDDMIYAKAFMKQVLESDLSDDNSFANRLTDDRYKNIAAAFNFGVSNGEGAAAQSNGQMDELFDTYDQTIAAQNDTIEEDTRYFKVMLGETGNITNVDQLLANPRLRDYLFTAYGIDTKYYNYNAIRGVLTSDPADPTSFYNTAYGNNLDQYNAAKTEDTELAERLSLSTGIPTLQDSIALGQQKKTDLETQIAAKQDELNNGGPATLQAEIDAMQVELTNTVQAIQTDQDNLTTSQTRYTELDGRLVPIAQTDSRRAELATIISAGASDAPYLALMKSLAEDFSFNADGSVPAGGAVTPEKLLEIVGGFFNKQTRITHGEAMFNQELFEQKLKTATNVSDFINDPRLLKYIKVAFNLDKVTVVKSTIEQILTSDLSDPDSYANRFGVTNPEYLDLAKAFNFATDGTVAAGQAQDELQTSTTRSDYMSRWDDKQEADLDKTIKFYKLDLSEVRTLDDFLSADADKSYDFALQAVGLDPATVSKLTIKSALKSDLSDPNSYIYKLKDERFVSLAKLFNFDPKGAVTRQVLLQSNAAITNVAKDYILRKSRFMEGDELKAARAKAQTEAKYYTDAMQRIGSRDELLADRKTLDILLISKGIDPSKVTNDFLKKAFNSDPADPKSFVNTQTDKRFAQLVGTFNFDSKGEIDRSSAGEAQNGGEVVATQDLYVRQLLENQQGEENPGVRLALYFERMSDSITDPYVILGDEALKEFFRVTFSLPAEIANMDVDQQAKIVKNKLNLEDLSDPEKVKKLVQRFTIMYDLENGQNTASAVSILSSDGSSVGISSDTLWALSQIRMG